MGEAGFWLSGLSGMREGISVQIGVPSVIWRKADNVDGPSLKGNTFSRAKTHNGFGKAILV